MFKRNSKGQFVKGDKFLIARNKSQKQKNAIKKSLTGRKKEKPVWNKGLKGWTIGTNAGFQKGNQLQGNTGKKASPETIEKLRKSHLGQKVRDQHPNWKGGVTSVNERIRKSNNYKMWRLDVYGRDSFTCQMPKCNKRGGDIESHHIKKFADFPKLRFDINNGITLCKKCHKLTKGKEEKFEKLFNEIIKRKCLSSMRENSGV